MKWIQDDSYVQRAVTRGYAVQGFASPSLPRWFWWDCWRPKLKIMLWNSAVILGAGERLAQAGYKLGFIANGRAFVGDETLHHRDAAIYVAPQSSWVFFAVGPDGEVAPSGSVASNNGDAFWFDGRVLDVDRESYLDGREIVD